MRAGVWTSFCLALLGAEPLIDSAGWASGCTSSDVLITAAAQKEIGEIERRIDDTEARALAQLKADRFDRSEQITLLGKLIYFDKNLSVNRNEACTFCHMPEAGTRTKTAWQSPI